MGDAIFDRAPDAEVSVPEGQWTNRYRRYGNVWFYVSDLERRIVPAGQHWLLHHIERLTLTPPAPTGTAGVVTEAMHDAAFRAYADQRFTFGVFEMTAADEHRIREALRKAVDAAFAALAAATGMGEQSDA